jgi:DNA-binding SARP family transcriptional activator/tetratricopeptide (TPR) repeat protein
VLGPVEVIGTGGVRAPLVGARQRCIVGTLALHGGRVVTVRRLVDVLWGDLPPRTAVKSVQSHIARVRQGLAVCGLGAALVTRGSGYQLEIAPAAVDSHRFERAVLAARAELADPAGAGERAGPGGSSGPGVGSAGADDALRRVAGELAAALAMWRGVPLADAAPAGWAAAEVDRLADLRLDALEDLCALRLRLGDPGADVEISRLLAANPLRERLIGLQMRVLYRAGRQTDALAAYRQARRRLAEELGVEPGPELVRLHTALLRGELARSGTVTGRVGPDPARPVPAQLPGRVGYFTGRAAELAALDRLLHRPGGDPGGSADEPRVVVVTGAAGMGKTGLAVEWAHRAARHFPDGSLYVDLRGHEEGAALTGAQALLHAVRGLGVAEDRVPSGVADRASLYRSLLHGRRVLVLLDNAGAADEVLPLVPGTGSSLLAVTSRTRLAALAAWHPVQIVELDVLSEGESVQLLTRVVGADGVGRVRAPVARLARLARLCGGIPLALRIAAANLVGRPDAQIAAFVTELAAADPLELLTVEGDSRSVRTVFATAYRALSPLAATVFRLSGLHPGPTIRAELAAALCGQPLPATRAALAELTAAHLLTAAADRYRFHDLIGLFARHCALRDEAPQHRRAALERLLDWYIAAADAANRLLDPSRDLITAAYHRGRPAVPFQPDRGSALAFLDAERDNLLPVVRYAAEHGCDTAAWQLTYLLNSYTDARGRWAERIELCRHGVAAAQRLGDPAGEGEMHRALGVAYRMTRRFDEALASHDRALAAVRAAGDARGEGQVFNCIGGAYTELRRYDEAVRAYERALELLALVGNAPGVALVQRNLGYVHTCRGRPDLGITYLLPALANSRAAGNARLEVAALDGLGAAHLRLREHAAARDYFEQTVAAARRTGDRRAEADALDSIGLISLDTGDPGTALDRFRAALPLSREVADRHLEAIVLGHLGRVLLRLGEPAAARRHLDLAIQLRLQVPDPYESGNLHRDLAELAAAGGDRPAAAEHRDRAAAYYRAADALREADDLISTVVQTSGTPPGTSTSVRT